jgi:hypothetical protein
MDTPDWELKSSTAASALRLCLCLASFTTT